MIPGNNYLIHSGDWHTWVGTYVKQVTPLLYSFKNLSKIDDTNNGDSWHELVADIGNSRAEATFIHYPNLDEDLYQIPISIIAMPWKGPTPQEAEENNV